MKMQALGLIETRGFTAAVEALDVAVKTANVTLLGIEFIGSGLVTIQITGDVSAVKVSIDAAVIGAQRVGEVVAAHVIPRPYDEIAKLIGQKETPEDLDTEPEPEPDPDSDPDSDLEPTPEPEIDSEPELAPEPELEAEPASEPEPEAQKKGFHKSKAESESDQLEVYTKEELNGMKVVDLRTLLRSFPRLKIKRNQIKFMNKEELLIAVQKFYEQNNSISDI